MTDTASPYPVKANDWFTLEVYTNINNPIISFTHKYQTSKGHDGGVVEYSFDGLKWNNVIGGCYTNTLTDSFYNASDTLTAGIPAFSGTSSWKRSRFQFFQNNVPLKQTASCGLKFPFLVRFRFVSDSTMDTLAGWKISNITIEKDFFGVGVDGIVSGNNLMVAPNPSTNGLFYFPELKGEDHYQISISDPGGKLVLLSKYKHSIDCRQLPAGLYFYRVSNGSQVFMGKLGLVW